MGFLGLTLNVWTPAGVGAGAKLPVVAVRMKIIVSPYLILIVPLQWIYGGLSR